MTNRNPKFLEKIRKNLTSQTNQTKPSQARQNHVFCFLLRSLPKLKENARLGLALLEYYFFIPRSTTSEKFGKSENSVTIESGQFQRRKSLFYCNKTRFFLRKPHTPDSTVRITSFAPKFGPSQEAGIPLVDHPRR